MWFTIVDGNGSPKIMTVQLESIVHNPGEPCFLLIVEETKAIAGPLVFILPGSDREIHTIKTEWHSRVYKCFPIVGVIKYGYSH